MVARAESRQDEKTWFLRALAVLQGSGDFAVAGARTLALPPNRGGPPLSATVTLWKRLER